MKNTIEDERVLAQRRKVQSDAYQILVCFLLVSILIQQFMLHAPFEQFAAEFFCLVGIGIYIAVRHITIGVDIWKFDRASRGRIVLNGLFSGIFGVVILMLLSGEKEWKNLLIFLGCYLAAFYAVHFILAHISRKRQKQIEKEMDDMENEE